MENKWLFFNNIYIRKSTIISYRLIGFTVELVTSYISINETFDDVEIAKKWLQYLHDELRES